MNKYTAIIYRFKKQLFILLIGTIALSIIGLFQVKLSTDFSLFSTNDSIYEERLDNLEDTFGTLNQITVLIEHDTFNDEVFLDLYSIQRKLEQTTAVSSVQGVAPMQLIINGNEVDSREVSNEMIVQYYSNFEEFSPMIQMDSTYYYSFTVFIDDAFGREEVRSIEEILQGYDYESYISGDEYNQAKITDYIIRILLILPPLALLTILIVFRWQMRDIKATLLSVVPAAIGSLWTLGLVGWMGNEVSMLTAVVPIFIIVIGSADGLHFMSHFQDLKREGIETKIALRKTLKLVGIPMIVTTLTSMAGFLSLLTLNTDSIYDLAVFSALGIFLAGVATWYVLPLILSNDINVLPKKQKTQSTQFFAKSLRFLWGFKSIVIVILLLVFSFLFQSNINHEFDMLMVYKESTEVAVNAEKVQEVNGGSIPLYVTIELDESPISIETMDRINTLAQGLKNMEEVEKVVNPYRFLEILYNINSDGDIPNDMVLQMLYTNASMNPDSTINNLVATNENVIRLLVFPTDLENDTLKEIEDYATEYTNTSVTGVQYMLRELNVNIAVMQLNSILLALGLVLIMMTISLKSTKIAFISLIPIIITVGSLYGFLGISSIPLNITTIIIFSITIGVGIDYAVHFSSIYTYYLKEGLSKENAVDKAYKNSSRPIITNALGISLGLSIMMLSPLTIHFNVSVLMWVSMIVSVLVTLTLLPTIFRMKKRWHDAK